MVTLQAGLAGAEVREYYRSASPRPAPLCTAVEWWGNRTPTSLAQGSAQAGYERCEAAVERCEAGTAAAQVQRRCGLRWARPACPLRGVAKPRRSAGQAINTPY